MTAWKAAPTKRETGRPRKKCPKCGNDMIVAKKAENWKSIWMCEKCDHRMPKVKGDVEYWK